jgi:hypothetical protein
MTDPRVIIALDPGGTTGVAFWVPSVMNKGNDRGEVWGREQIGSPETPCSQDVVLEQLMYRLTGIGRFAEPYTGTGEVHLVVESFDFRKDEAYRDKIDYTAGEVIGAIRYWCLNRPHVKFIRAGAGLGKGFWDDDKIKKLGLWVPGQRHAMDATRHLLRYRAFALNDKSLFEPFRPSQYPFAPPTNQP